MEDEDRDLSKGQRVVFFQGRSPRQGIIKEKLDSGDYLLVVKSNGGQLEIVKPADELKPFSAVQGKYARIRFT